MRTLITREQYDEICRVIDHVKQDDELEDTDFYVGEILDVLELGLQGERSRS